LPHSEKEMKRHLFNGLVALSLIFFISTSALWTQSYWAPTALINKRDFPAQTTSTNLMSSKVRERIIFISTSRGELMLARSLSSDGDLKAAQGWDLFSTSQMSVVIGPTLMNRCGFGLRLEHDGEASFTRMMIPFWFLFILTAILPFGWIVFYFKRRARLIRIVKGLCEKCGYDLRATPNACPECGTIPSKQVVSY
jgi:hypothetical protein